MSESAPGDDLLADLLSRDPIRIWSATSAVVRCWEDPVLDRLAGQEGEIRAATAGVELGGLLVRNADRLDVALRRLRHHRTRRGCLCQLYRTWLFYDPVAEAEAGHVRLDGPPDDTGRRRATCTRCETTYHADEGESHYRWWSWSRARPRRAGS